MKRQDAYEFWLTYMKLITKDGADIEMSNPLHDFKAQAHAGDFDELSDETYYERYERAEEVASFWKGASEKAVGKVFLEALKQTPIGEAEVKDLAMMLAEISERTTYDWEERNREAEKSQEPKAKGHGQEDKRLQEKERKERNKERNQEADAGFEAFYGETPFDTKPYQWTPHRIYDYLGEYVYGQEEAKRGAAIMLYHHMKGRRRNMILTGPTGCGKTEIWRTLQKQFPFIKIVNGPQLACDGWKGSYHMKDIFLEEPTEKVKKLLVVIDEADKLFEPMVGSGGTDFSRAIQNEFLKVMDGDEVTFVPEESGKNPVSIDCSNISFVFCGSFETLRENRCSANSGIGFGQSRKSDPKEDRNLTEEDLIEYGNVRREIAGRIQQIVVLDDLDATDFEQIMKSPKRMSPIRQIEEQYEVAMELDDRTRQSLARRAADSGLGCRYIRSQIQGMLDEKIFDEPEQTRFRFFLPKE